MSPSSPFPRHGSEGQVTRCVGALLMLSALTPCGPSIGNAQTADRGEPRDTVALGPVTVTATRTAKDVFLAPTPVSVLDHAAIRQGIPNGVTDLFRDLPGLDVTGVGVTQVRPMIRGQRGQRILVLEDGMRLNNSRRQQDFGEIPALVDVSMVDRVEVVRGPASVLYGSDAIGGVVNIITQTPDAEGLHGMASYRYSTHDTQNKVAGALSGRFGAFAFRTAGTYRNADPYEAPSGRFGDIRLNQATPVFGTGVQDESFNFYTAYDVARQQKVFAKYERYRADTTGFGFIDPAVYAPGMPDIQIDYPFQRFDKITAGYQGVGLDLPFADRLDVVGYYQDNERRFDLDVVVPDIPLGNPADPATPIVDIRTFSTNFTDLSTVGTRVEASKLVGGRVILTYGADFFHDDSNNNDSSMVEFGFPDPIGSVPVSADTVALVPDASLQSVGVYMQGDIQLTGRASLILGARFQSVHAQTDDSVGLSDTDHTLVAAASGVYELTDNLAAVVAVGRAFRAPNLVERFFNGPTPEGLAFQMSNANLEPETSLNVDLGLRFRDPRFNLEGFVFRNEIRNGIRISPTSETTAGGLPIFQNVNIEKLRFWGVELAGDVRLPAGLSVGGTYTHQDSKDVLDENNPVGESFDEKVTGRVRYTYPGDRFWIEYGVRHNGERKEAELLIGNPVGDVFPAFTVHAIRAGVTVFHRGPHVQRLGIILNNLTNELYAEFANAAFFRPEPGRSITLTWDMSF